MKLLVDSAMIFFGTLMAAGLVALGEPTRTDRITTKDPSVTQLVKQLLWPAARR